jgi:hypothetical protein
MCLKFLLENNPANQALVESLKAQQIAPPTNPADTEILHKLGEMGMEVSIGDDGRPRVLRRSNDRVGRGGVMGMSRKQAGREVNELRSRFEEVREDARAMGLPVKDRAVEEVGKETKGKERATEAYDETVDFM